MGFQIILAPRAIRDLEAIVRYIAVDNSVAAVRLGQALISKAKTVGQFPESGRVVPEFDDASIREVIYNHYRIVYRVNSSTQTVDVIRFWHAARGAPSL
jgi:toxin ParE1/3/4